jgi:DNA polymerase-3 subunit delta
MKKLAEEIKNNKISDLYLFYGEEGYLKRQYLNLIEKALFEGEKDMMNYDTFEGKSCDVTKIADALKTMPFMKERRLIAVKDSRLFINGRKNDSQYILEELKDIPESTVIVFIEDEVDKRSALYKFVNKEGKAVEFKFLKEAELTGWVVRRFMKLNIGMNQGTAAYFIRSVSPNMEPMEREIEKLSNYVEKNVTKADIDTICTKSIESRIFDLTGAIGMKNTAKALEIYSNLMLLKESPIMVLSMLARQFRIILQVKEYRGLSSQEIGTELSLHSFVVSEAMKQGEKFSRETLISALKECLETDVAIKTGRMGDKLGVEMLIVKYSGVLELI